MKSSMKSILSIVTSLVTFAILAGCTTTPAIDANGNPILGPDGKQATRVCVGLSCPVKKAIYGAEMGKEDEPGNIKLGTIHFGSSTPTQPAAQPAAPAPAAQAPAPAQNNPQAQ
jgi:hypothetical protein